MGDNNATAAEFLAAREPTGPEGISVWQLLRGDRSDPLARWTRIREEHGDVARYRYGLDDVHFVTHPEGARRVLQENAGNYTKRHPAYGMLRRLVGDGLVTSDGDLWLRQRRLAQPAFHRQRIAGMAAGMTRAALEVAERWEALADRGDAVPMLREMSRLTLRVVGDALFGAALPAKAALVGEAWDVLNNQMVERFSRMRLLPPVLPTRYDREFREAKRTMLRLVDEIIADKRARGADGGDLLSMLLEARDEDTGEGMTDAQLRDEVVTMVVGGHETTAVALSWAWALLDRHPDARAKLSAELAAALGGRAPAFEDLPKLRYTRAVVDEALRLYPPAYILFRRVVADDVVCGCRVRRGGVVTMTPVVFHRHPAFWERPDVFDPDRWADPDAEKRRPRFTYMPFSGGPRQCIGNGFALTEAVLALATLAQRFAPRVADGHRPTPEYLVTLRPAGGLPMRIERAA